MEESRLERHFMLYFLYCFQKSCIEFVEILSHIPNRRGLDWKEFFQFLTKIQYE